MISDDVSIKVQITLQDPIDFDVVSSIQLPYRKSPNKSNNFLEIIESRHSSKICKDITLERLAYLFYASCRTKYIETNSVGITVQKRNYPSAGAMHTIDCIVTSFKSDDWYLYNPQKHTFDLLRLDPLRLSNFKHSCLQLLDDRGEGCLIWYVCDIERLSCKYINAELLALREAGAISCIHGLLAESDGLAFSMLGLTGRQHAKAISNQSNLLGVGTAIVGEVV